jgi:predicted transcriptional regulator
MATARRTAGKPRTGRAGETGRLRSGKVTLRLDAELARRLAVVAAARGVTQSELVAELVAPYLQRWRVPNGPELAVVRGGEMEQPAESSDGPRPRVVGL